MRPQELSILTGCVQDPLLHILLSFNSGQSRKQAALQCRPIEAPIGKVDLELDLYMTQDGVQVGILETASRQNDTQTRTWNQILGQ